jgi:hypothetical protein
MAGGLQPNLFQCGVVGAKRDNRLISGKRFRSDGKTKPEKVVSKFLKKKGVEP